MADVDFAEIFWAVDYNARDSLALDMFSDKARRGILRAGVKTVVDIYNKDGGTPRPRGYWSNCLVHGSRGGEFHTFLWGFSSDFISRIAWDIVEALPDRMLTDE